MLDGWVVGWGKMSCLKYPLYTHYFGELKGEKFVMGKESKGNITQNKLVLLAEGFFMYSSLSVL